MADGKKTALETETDAETGDERSVYLKNGRTLATRSEGSDEIVEIRAASGQVELKIKVTEDGPVLSVEGIKLEMKAAESVGVSCKTFRVDAEESVELASKGELSVTSEKDANIESKADVRVLGKMIWLN